MNKKLILLILALPLFLMISLFTATSSISLAVSVPVSGIEYTGESVVYLDLDLGQSFRPEYTVYPTSAANKSVTLVTEAVGDAPLCELELSDGVIRPKSAGMAKVYLTTVDGGYRDSFIVSVDSVVLKEITAELSSDALYVGETAMLVPQFYPANTKDKVVGYRSDNERVLSVNDKGVITALAKGSATVTVYSVTHPEICDTVEITVLNREALDLSASEITTSASAGTLSASVDSAVAYELSYRVTDTYGNAVSDAILSLSLKDEQGAISLAYAFTDTGFYGTLMLEITIRTELGLELTKTCKLVRVKELGLRFDAVSTPAFHLGSNVLGFTLTPRDADVTYEAWASNDNVTNLVCVGSRIIFKANRAGVTTVFLRVTDNESAENTKTVSIDIAILPHAIDVVESGKTYGDEDLLTVGRTDVSGADTLYPLHLTFGSTELGEGFLENVGFLTDTDKVTVEDGKIRILDPTFTGIVSVRARFAYGDAEHLSAPFRFRAVGDAYNVYSYLDLLRATREEKPVVLHNDITEDFGYDENGRVVYEEIESTYDTDMYKNGKPTVKVLLSFRADLYGNGYTVSAHNVTYRLDSTGALLPDALFRGPLNFVDMTEGDLNSGGGMVSVKAQDNVAFAVYGGVSLRNVTLKSCELTEYEGKYDLTDLNYVGTTVEVFGDGVTIAHSRLTNGRTVLRAFGDAEDPDRVIHVNLENSTLSSAREFLLRMGSNKFVQGSTSDPSPKLEGDTLASYPAQAHYSNMTAGERAAYDESFIKTFVTVKDSTLRDAGIFAIGVDSHFAGSALADGSSYKFLNGLIDHWQGMAKTSYGAKLTFEGDVNMYCWKPLSEVDSSTLIEIVGSSQYAEKLSFDVEAMVRSISNKSGFTSILTKYKGVDYVHAGIAFFGGGKNYGVFENATSDAYNTYSIGLSDVDAQHLEAAAGSEKFYFVIYDSSSSFSPEEQEKQLGSGS